MDFDFSQMQVAPCPECGGVRYVGNGQNFGLAATWACYALYCTNCGHLTFYAGKPLLRELEQHRAENAQERADQAARDAKRLEKDRQRGKF